MRSLLVALALSVAALACNTGPAATAEPAPAASAAPIATTTAALRLGAAIETTAPKVALADVAKKPADYVGKTFATTGTVTSVCQHMGCWMELKDESGSDAHVKMAGHKFFVPKTASGKKARVLAKLDRAENAGSCEGAGHEGGEKGEKKGCRAEAEEQLGHPLAKLELVAEGVELL